MVVILLLNNTWVVQDSAWDMNIDGPVRELYVAAVNKLDLGVEAQKNWMASAGSSQAGSSQEPCTTCKASTEKVCFMEPLSKMGLLRNCQGHFSLTTVVPVCQQHHGHRPEGLKIIPAAGGQC